VADRSSAAGDGKEVGCLSFGKMDKNIEIITSVPCRDTEGFAVPTDTVIANVRAYFERRNTSEKWRNNAVFAEASALFRFRFIPGVTVDNSMVILYGGERYNIISAENVRGRGMYMEIMAKAQIPSVGVNGSG
jgi:SPP1 family predicted phage head-tail adaptor